MDKIKKTRKLYRSSHDKMIAGVCGGLGHYFKFDPTIIRLIMIFICIFTAIFPLFIAYIIAALIIPLEQKETSLKRNYKKLYRSRTDRKIAGIFGGIGTLIKIDPAFLRLLFLFLFFITGIIPLLLTYIIGWIIIPEYPQKEDYIEI